jgi:recombination protein RecA
MAATKLVSLLDRLGPGVALADAALDAADLRSGGQGGLSASRLLGWPELDALLPEGGLPPGVTELASDGALGGATGIALAAVFAAQRGNAEAVCAWVDPEATLYAPGVALAGVDLSRLLVVRPPRAELSRIAVKVAASGAFDVVVVDLDPLADAAAKPVEPARHGRTETPPRSLSNAKPTKTPKASKPSKSEDKRRRAFPPEVLVRKLALAAEENGASILLLSNTRSGRAAPLPVALRLVVERPDPFVLSVEVTKDRRGRIGRRALVPLRTRPMLARKGIVKASLYEGDAETGAGAEGASEGAGENVRRILGSAG